MSYEDLIGRIAQALPETAGKLTVERVLYKKSEKRALFSFLSETIIGDRAFFTIKQIIAEVFPGLQFSLRVASPALKDDFIAHPDKYAHIFSSLLLRAHPATASWEFDMRWLSENGRIILEMPDEFSLEFYQKENVPELLSTAIFDIFRDKPPVLLRLRGDSEKRLARIAEERAREAEMARERALREMQAPKVKSKKEQGEGQTRVKGRQIASPPVAIGELTDDCGQATIRGKVLDVDVRDISNGDARLVKFSVTDFTATVTCKAFFYYRERRRKDDTSEPPPITPAQRKTVNDAIDMLKLDIGVLVRGACQYDKFSRETVLMAQDIFTVPLEKREDNAPEKRVELHAHTQMSNMDATTPVAALIARAAAWGHKAIAITDHGVVQAFPDAFSAAKKNGIKLIPGVEGYLAEDERVVENGDDRPLSSPIVVLDFETTGLDAKSDRIIEIGAVRLEDGVIKDSLSLLVNPQRLLKEKIVELTGITDAMLAGAETADSALPKLMRFIGDCPLAAHNARFDCAFLEAELARLGQTYECPRVDTLSMARKLYPELKSHKLGAICKKLGVSLKDAHRAVHDARATALCLAQMLTVAKTRGAQTLRDIDDVAREYALGSNSHIILLAASQKGLQNINRMVSASHLKYFKRRPHMPRELIQQYREGVIVGSACESGELFSAVLAGASEDKLRKIARFYDYLEIQPIGNNAFLTREGRVKDDEGLRDLNRVIVRLGEKLGIPVVATGDVHFLDQEDSAFRAILQAGQGYEDCDKQPPLYFKTTEEMLEEFAYLGADKAREVVIDNPAKIVARVGEITLFPKHPEGKTTFSPLWETAADDIARMARKKAHALYGDELPELVEKRLDKELTSIVGYGYATLYSIANKLVTKSLSDGYLVGSRGSVGSSFVATMCDITEVNPLPPHYRCTACRKAFFDVPEGCTVGPDLPDRQCPDCGATLIKDGYDIPFEVFLGFKGDKVPDIDLNFSGEYQPRAHAYVEELFGAGSVFRAGTIGTLADKTAYGYVMKYLEERGQSATEAEKNRLAAGCVGVKRTTGQHPGGMVVLPKGYDINEFTAVQHPADDQGSGIVTTHYDFGSMHDVLVKLDILGHDDPTMMHMLEELTGVNFREIPLDDRQVMSLFLSPEALGVTAKDIDCETGTLGVPEFGTSFVRQMLGDTKPTTMEELIRLSGLSHGTNVWLGNAKDIISQGIAPLRDCICTRDDIMNALIARGVPDKMAFDTMEKVRKGMGLTREMESAMREHNVPEWFIDSCLKIKYMFPKGHAVAYVTMALRVAWYKVYRPLAYYAAYFTIRGDGFDAATMLLSPELLREKLAELAAQDEQKQLSGKEKDMVTALEILLEMEMRGFTMLPVDLYKSELSRFTIEGNALRAPFTALGGLGESAARGIIETRAQPYVSVEDLKTRAKISSAVVELLQSHGCLSGMADTSQVSLFQLL